MSRPRAASRSRRPAGAAVVLSAGLLVVVVLLAGYGWWRSRPKPAPQVPAGPPVAGLTTQDMLDSLRAQYAARHWVKALQWAHAANVSAPGSSGLLLNEALAWHNYAQDPSQEWPGRSASRTSLDRMEREKFAFALLDSAEAVAATTEELANIWRWRAVQYEGLGLPLDAVQAYDQSLKAQPGFRESLKRLAWLQRVFIKPSDPTSVTASESTPLP